MVVGISAGASSDLIDVTSGKNATSIWSAIGMSRVAGEALVKN